MRKAERIKKISEKNDQNFLMDIQKRGEGERASPLNEKYPIIIIGLFTKDFAKFSQNGKIFG
jgi:hypothetical protein